MGKAERKHKDRPPPDPMARVLSSVRKPEETGFEQAWIGMEPTFSSRKAVRLWQKLSETPEGEVQFFHERYMLGTQRRVARGIEKQYRARQKEGALECMFERVEAQPDVDQWGVERQNLVFSWGRKGSDPFEVRFGMDPETFEYSIKPVPLVWFYDQRFLKFLQSFVWDVPQKLGLAPSMAHGGGQFSVSAKTFMDGSLLADDIATRLNHPELSTWVMCYINPDERPFRATRPRRAAFEGLIEAYWAGGFHPQVLGPLRVENAYLDRGFGPAPPRPGLMDPLSGPLGDTHEVFQTNFAFGRAVRLQGQNVHPGYWQACHSDEDGYRPDQIMRYSEGNLNRLQIAGEWHVKSGKVLDLKDVPELDAPLALSMLYDEASWEHRAQMSRTSAVDFVEAVLLEMHHALYLKDHPHVVLGPSLLQDQLLGEAEQTLQRHAPKVLGRLRKQARGENLASSRGRLKTDFVEPEVLFWAAWRAMPAGERAAIAREVVTAFVERVDQAAAYDPRPGAETLDPMEPHRHRIHPLLWKALEEEGSAMAGSVPVKQEWKAWSTGRKKYKARRPPWSVTDARPPWKASRP